MKKNPGKSPEFQRFEALTKRLLGATKQDIDEKEKERKVRRRKAKPSSD
jgi:hypothetical protein